jgi:hypothetical protein
LKLGTGYKCEELLLPYAVVHAVANEVKRKNLDSIAPARN